jgi:hypothetical protein
MKQEWTIHLEYCSPRTFLKSQKYGLFKAQFLNPRCRDVKCGLMKKNQKQKSRSTVSLSTVPDTEIENMVAMKAAHTVKINLHNASASPHNETKAELGVCGGGANWAKNGATYILIKFSQLYYHFWSM